MDPKESAQPTLSISTRVFLRIAYGLFLLIVWIPSAAAFLLLGLAALWVTAAYGLVHSGGIALPLSWFQTCSTVAVFVALAALAAGAERVQRERTISPGGRVIAVQHQTRWRWPRLPLRFHGALIPLLFLVVYLGEWDGNPWLPDGLSLALLLIALYAYSGAYALALLRAMFWLARALWRFAHGGPFRAGACTTLMAVACLATLTAEVERGPKPPEEWGLPAGGARGLLVELAEVTEPTLALREELRRFFAPLLDQVPEALGRAETSSALTRYAGDFIGDRPDWEVGDRGAWEQCMNTLWPQHVRTQRRVLEQQFHQLDRDQVYDIVMGALTRVCLYASAKPVTYLEQLFKVAAHRLTLDQLEKHRRGYRTFCSDDEDTSFFDRCPAPGSSPEDLAHWRLQLAQVNWCEISPQQRAFIIEGDLLGMTDREIAARHGRSSETYVKDTRNNAHKKIRKKLAASCLFQRD